jgi:hypothetical protein
MDEKKFVCFNGAAQMFAFAFQAFVHGVVEEVVGHGMIILFILERDVA